MLRARTAQPAISSYRTYDVDASQQRHGARPTTMNACIDAPALDEDVSNNHLAVKRADSSLARSAPYAAAHGGDVLEHASRRMRPRTLAHQYMPPAPGGYPSTLRCGYVSWTLRPSS